VADLLAGLMQDHLSMRQAEAVLAFSEEAGTSLADVTEAPDSSPWSPSFDMTDNAERDATKRCISIAC